MFIPLFFSNKETKKKIFSSVENTSKNTVTREHDLRVRRERAQAARIRNKPELHQRALRLSEEQQAARIRN